MSSMTSQIGGHQGELAPYIREAQLGWCPANRVIACDLYSGERAPSDSRNQPVTVKTTTYII